MVHLRFLKPATLLVTALAVLSTAGASTTNASNIQARYESAQAVEKIVTALQSKIIPAEIKSSLLDGARAEDKDFAKSVVVNWKSYNDTNAFAEFDELLVLDEEGRESLRMKVLEAPHSFQINGRAWTVPATGSISKSLREHLETATDDSASASSASKKFARYLNRMLPTAFAAKPNAALAPAYLFASGVTNRTLPGPRDEGPRPELNNQPATTTEALIEKSPKQYLVHDGSLLGILKSFISLKVECRAGSAHGSARVNGDRLAFESRPDGSLIFTVDDEAKTKLLVTSETSDQRKWVADQQAALASFLQSKPMNQALAKKIFQGFFTNAPLDDHDRMYRQTAETLRTTMHQLARDGDYGRAVRKHSHELSEFYKSRTRRVISEKMAAAKCVNPDCSTIESGNQRSTIQHWLSKDGQRHIANALKWTPKNSPRSPARITQTQTTGTPVYAIEPIKYLSKSDMAEAEKLVTEAHRASQRSSNNVKNMTLSLRPLGACCAETECRKSLLDTDTMPEPKKSRPVKK